LNKDLSILKEKKLFLFDLDGVLYKGKEDVVYISGRKIISKLKTTGKKVLILTNNSTESTDRIYQNLRKLGFEIETDEILTSSMLTGLYIKKRWGSIRYFLLGEKGLETELSKFGHKISNKTDVDALVVGLDRFLTYEKLNMAVEAAMKSRRIIATHASRFYMSRDGPALATGPVLKAIEYASMVKSIVIGKPSRLMFDLALKISGFKREEAIMIGDQLDTDIAGAERAGIDSVLVMTGVDKKIDGTTALALLPEADSLTKYL
jgi:4-nitrophenyl phosphatase